MLAYLCEYSYFKYGIWIKFMRHRSSRSITGMQYNVRTQITSNIELSLLNDIKEYCKEHRITVSVKRRVNRKT